MDQMTEFDKIVKNHENEIGSIQRAIQPLIKAGLKVTDEDLLSLSYEGALKGTSRRHCRSRG